MKKVLFAAAGLAALGMAAPASAADLAAKPYVKAPPAPPPAIYDWTGFYIGANGGWGQSHNCLDFITLVGTVASGCSDRSGGVVGGQLGYRWQTGSWVWGVEGQGDWADLSNTRVSLFDPTLSTRVKTDGIGLITGQVGYAWNAALLYFKGGAAVTGNRFSVCDTLNGLCGSLSNTRWGGTVGTGIEVGFGPNWSVGAEFDYLFMGTKTLNLNGVPATILSRTESIQQNVGIGLLRVNYRFGGPVVARY